MENVKHLKCIKCNATYPAKPDTYTCSQCGGILDVRYDYEYISQKVNKETFNARKEFSMWRYREFLPIEEESPVSPLRVGWSPLYKAERLGETLGLSSLYVKDDGLNPTASLKDRASAVAVVKAKEAGADTVACSSTGNAASSLAGNAASMGLKACIFVPGRAPEGKVAQLLIFGARVVSVQGSYEDTFKLSAEAIERWGWYNRNAAINPYLVEGKKTVSLEIAEQLNWQAPDWVVVSVGDGCTIAGVWKGFKDLYQAGLIDRLPRLLSVQAAGCCPINRAVMEDKPWEPMPEDTLADSIAVGVPRNPDKAINAIKESNGLPINVSDQEILDAMKFLGNSSGIFGEPAGVAGLAGLKKAVSEGKISHTETVVNIVTGNGLKDVANAVKAAGEPLRVAPSMEELLQAFKTV
ncbi:MAG: threonine synthase [Clostridiales bacterium]|jgi:threonine synthase|nr:threonine synthase [Clostridiales bacterium]